MPSQDDRVVRRVHERLAGIGESEISLSLSSDPIIAEPRAAGQPVVDAPSSLQTARAWIHARRARDRAFENDLFFDPAWAMLLDLYIARCERRDVGVSSLCAASNVPMTTALRVIASMEEKLLLFRVGDPFDRRRSYIRLTADAVTRLERAFDGAIESDRRLGIERFTRTQ